MYMVSLRCPEGQGPSPNNGVVAPERVDAPAPSWSVETPITQGRGSGWDGGWWRHEYTRRWVVRGAVTLWAVVWREGRRYVGECSTVVQGSCL